MSLPSYDKSKRKQTFEGLPKGAYVCRIIGAIEEPNKSGKGSHLKVVLDIAEGDYAGIFQRIYDKNSNEDKKWPNDGTYYLTVPADGAPQYVWDNWNTFFADLEDSNNGFVFSGTTEYLRGKLIGGKFAIEQSEYNGRIYDHTKLKWTCVADDVRQGKAGKMPADKMIEVSYSQPSTNEDGFMEIPDGLNDADFPFR